MLEGQTCCEAGVQFLFDDTSAALKFSSEWREVIAHVASSHTIDIFAV
jgi:hypothetical protein